MHVAVGCAGHVVCGGVVGCNAYGHGCVVGCGGCRGVVRACGRGSCSGAALRSALKEGDIYRPVELRPWSIETVRCSASR